MRLFLMTMTATLTSANIRIFMVEAVLTRSSTDNSPITRIMNAAVMAIATCGVPNRALVLEKTSGMRPSLLMAMGERDAERMPALAVVAKAKNAAKPTMTRPAYPIVAAAPSAMGMSEPDRRWPSTVPTVTRTTATYDTDTTPNARNIPKGRLRLG